MKRVMERIARRERHPQVRREAQARRGSAAKRLAQKILFIHQLKTAIRPKNTLVAK
jgi:hypothetical protein